MNQTLCSSSAMTTIFLVISANGLNKFHQMWSPWNNMLWFVVLIFMDYHLFLIDAWYQLSGCLNFRKCNYQLQTMILDLHPIMITNSTDCCAHYERSKTFNRKCHFNQLLQGKTVLHTEFILVSLTFQFPQILLWFTT